MIELKSEKDKLICVKIICYRIVKRIIEGIYSNKRNSIWKKRYGRP